MNKMGTVPNIPRESFLTPPGQKQDLTSCKFIDDNITAVSVNLKQNLIVDDSITQPAVFHSRTGHSLPDENNPLIPKINNIINFTDKYEMQINTKKTNIMLFSL